MGICIYANQLDDELISILYKEYGEEILDHLDSDHHIMISGYIDLDLYENSMIAKSDTFHNLQEFKDIYYGLKMEQLL